MMMKRSEKTAEMRRGRRLGLETKGNYMQNENFETKNCYGYAV
jgi:hypothetical protein